MSTLNILFEENTKQRAIAAELLHLCDMVDSMNNSHFVPSNDLVAVLRVFSRSLKHQGDSLEKSAQALTEGFMEEGL